jgi:hypothetical protein
MTIPTSGNFDMFGTGSTTTIAGAIQQHGGIVAGVTDFESLRNLTTASFFDSTYAGNITDVTTDISASEQFRNYPQTPEPTTPEPTTPEPTTPEPTTPEPTPEPTTPEPTTPEPTTPEPITPEPTPEPTTPEPTTPEPITPEPITPAPVTLYTITLESGSVDCATVCANYGSGPSGTLYGDGATLGLSSYLYKSYDINDPAEAYFYTDGTDCRAANSSGLLGSTTSCATPAPVNPTTYVRLVLCTDSGTSITGYTTSSHTSISSSYYTGSGVTEGCWRIEANDLESGTYNLDIGYDKLIDCSVCPTPEPTTPEPITPEPTTPSPTPAPVTLYSLTLESGSVDCATVCANYGSGPSGTLYGDGATLGLSSYLYKSYDINDPAEAYFYTDGTDCRAANSSGLLGSTTSCATPAPVNPTTYVRLVLCTDSGTSITGYTTSAHTSISSSYYTGSGVTEGCWRIEANDLESGTYNLDIGYDKLIDCSVCPTPSPTPEPTPEPTTPEPITPEPITPSPTPEPITPAPIQVYHWIFQECGGTESITGYTTSTLTAGVTAFYTGSGPAAGCWEAQTTTSNGTYNMDEGFTALIDCSVCPTPEPTTPEPTTPEPTTPSPTPEPTTPEPITPEPITPEPITPEPTTPEPTTPEPTPEPTTPEPTTPEPTTPEPTTPSPTPEPTPEPTTPEPTTPAPIQVYHWTLQECGGTESITGYTTTTVTAGVTAFYTGSGAAAGCWEAQTTTSNGTYDLDTFTALIDCSVCPTPEPTTPEPITPEPTTPSPTPEPTTPEPTTPEPITPSPTPEPTTPEPTTPEPTTPEPTTPSPTPEPTTPEPTTPEPVTPEPTTPSPTPSPTPEPTTPEPTTPQPVTPEPTTPSPTPSPTPEPTTPEPTTPEPTTPEPTTPAPVVTYAITLEYGSVDCATVCANYGSNPSGTFYMDVNNFAIASYLYSNTNRDAAPANFYTNDVICRPVGSGGALGSTTSCATPSPVTPSPTPEPTTPEPTTPQPTTPSPTPEPTTPSPTPSPTPQPTTPAPSVTTYGPKDLGYDPSSTSNACDDYGFGQSYYSDCDISGLNDWSSGCKVYTNSTGTNALAGYYSDGSFVWSKTLTGGLSNQSLCF